MTFLAATGAVLAFVVLLRLVIVVRRDDVRHIPASHWADAASAHDRWERVG